MYSERLDVGEASVSESVSVSGEHKRHPTFQRESPANTGGLQ